MPRVGLAWLLPVSVIGRKPVGAEAGGPCEAFGAATCAPTPCAAVDEARDELGIEAGVRVAALTVELPLDRANAVRSCAIAIALAGVGWEPIPRARSSLEGVKVEALVVVTSDGDAFAWLSADGVCPFRALSPDKVEAAV